jgi:hypothetical protein
MIGSTQSGAMIVILTADNCAELGLRAPLAVEIDVDVAGIVAKVLDPTGIDSFGAGATIQEAIKDLVEVMRAEALSLRSRHARLSTDMARELAAIDAALADEGVAIDRPSAYIVTPMKSGSTGLTFSAVPASNSYIPLLSPTDTT